MGDVPVVVDVPVDNVPGNEEPGLATVDGGISIDDAPEQATINDEATPDQATINDEATPDQATINDGATPDQATFDGGLNDELDQATFNDDVATFYDGGDGASRTL